MCCAKYINEKTKDLGNEQAVAHPTKVRMQLMIAVCCIFFFSFVAIIMIRAT